MHQRRYFWIGLALLVAAIAWGAGSWLSAAATMNRASVDDVDAFEDDFIVVRTTKQALFRSLWAIPVAMAGIPLVIVGLERERNTDCRKAESQLSVRLLLVLTLYVASYFALMRISFPVAIAAAGFLPATATGLLCSLDALRPTRKLKLSNVSLMVCTWIGAYLVSIGPVLFVVDLANTRLPKVVYAPVLWIVQNTPLRPRIEEYIMAWEHFGRV